jgi:hypothetical protein
MGNSQPETGEEMTDTTNADDTATETTAAASTATETETDWKAEAEKWKANSRKNEDNAKANAAAAKKLAELEEANKSEIEKAQARAEAAEKELNSTRIEALRNSVALDKKLTPSQAKRLVGSTREELEADADELLADLKNTQPNAVATSDGQGKQGEPVGQTKQITSRDQLTNMTRAEIDQARKEGRLDSLTG